MRERAKGWLERLRDEDLPEKEHALDTFFRLLADRLDTVELQALFAEEDVMRETATGRRLLEEGREEGRRELLTALLRARLGAEADGFVARLAGCPGPVLERIGSLLVHPRRSRAQLVEGLSDLFDGPRSV